VVVSDVKESIVDMKKEYNKLSKKEKKIVDEFADIFIKYRHLGSRRLLEIVRDLLPYSK
jgi:hypothetical protein